MDTTRVFRHYTIRKDLSLALAILAKRDRTTQSRIVEEALALYLAKNWQGFELRDLIEENK